MKKHSESYYWNARDRIWRRLAELPQGTIKERLISGRTYFYFQRREGKKVIHTYIGKEVPADLKKKMREREALRAELAEIQDVMRGILTGKIRNIL